MSAYPTAPPTAGPRPLLASPPGGSAIRGILLMCLGVSFFPLLNAAVKLLTEHYSIVEIVWARFTGHLAWMLLLFLPRHGWRVLVAHRPYVQIARSFLLLGSTTFFVSGIGFVPLATASAIGFTSPFLVTALSVPLLGEPVGTRRWTAVIIGFLGALIVIRPQPTLDGWAVLLLLGAALCYALYQVMTRKGGAHDHAGTAIIYAALAGAVATSLVMPFDAMLPRQPLDWALFAAIGFFGGFGHYFVVRAFQNAPAAVISPFGYLELAGTTLLGYLLFGDFPDGWTWVGVAIIVACGVYVAYRERKRRGERHQA